MKITPILVLSILALAAPGQAIQPVVKVSEDLTSAEADAAAEAGTTMREEIELKGGPDGEAGRETKRIIVRAIEAPNPDAGGERSWLGLSVSETPEALNAQLGLAPGAGLTVDYVAPDSPAARAGFQKHDVLVKFESQLLVHPAQFRKLVQTRKEGDEVTLAFYRGGREQSVKVVVGTAKGEPLLGVFGGEWEKLGPTWNMNMQELQRQLKELPLEQGFRDQMKGLRESLSNLKIDQAKVQEELRASLEEARRSLERALSQSSNLGAALDPARQALKRLEETRVVDRNARVTVRSEGQSVRSLVHSDDAGTLVIVADPQPRLTAHDKNGKLLFDGPVQNAEQQSQVPREVWERAEPLVKRLMEEGTSSK